MRTTIVGRFLLTVVTALGLVTVGLATSAAAQARSGAAGPAVAPMADPSATVSLQRTAKGTRLAVEVTGTEGRVRTIVVRVGGRAYPLTGRAAAWRSQTYSGRAERRLLATVGATASIRVRTSTGTSRVTAVVTGQGETTTGGTTGGGATGTTDGTQGSGTGSEPAGSGTGGEPGAGPTGTTDGTQGSGPGPEPGGTGASTASSPGPLFTPPSAALSGQAGADWILPYLLNSQFSDCAAGAWPACAVEYVYTHCPTNSQSYQRITSVSGPDINSFGQFQLTGAQVGADGSWIVEYYHQLAGADTLTGYRWEVSASGQVVGAYWYGVTPFTSPPTEILGPYLYRRHACTG